MLRIKDKTLQVPLLLAPMAGLTHSALRTLLVSCGGVGLLSTEMLAARRLPTENQFISPYLIKTVIEQPLSYQLLITERQEIKPAVDALHRFDADVIDLNLGCPAPRVRKSGGGSSLMAAPDRVREIVRTVRRATDLPLSAKIRLGEHLDETALRDFCLMLEGEGLNMLTVHARLRSESFARKPRWEWVGKVKTWLQIPVVANGGIFSVEDAVRCLALSGADGLMIGRAAAEKPWIFSEISKEVYGQNRLCPQATKPQMYAQFVVGLLRFRPERRLGRLKEFTHYFARNYAFGHHLAMAVQKSQSHAQGWELAVDFFAQADPDGLSGVDLDEIRGQLVA